MKSLLANLLDILKSHKLYLGLMACIVGASIYCRVTETRIANWFSDETEKHGSPGSHGGSRSHSRYFYARHK